MRSYQFLLLFNLALVACPEVLAENTIQISIEQMTSLGVKLRKMEVVSEFPVVSVPAKVVIPPSQEYVVSAAQAGFIEKLNVAIGDKVVKGQLLALLNSPDLLVLQQEYLKADNALQLVSATYQRDIALYNQALGVTP
ncbi:MAG: efflux RND transporter periplasmic adaptor subunit [Methylobacter sp.]|nr:efflux RND transporter periplasmic adaptor subunit [Methylobacter sp.]